VGTLSQMAAERPYRSGQGFRLLEGGEVAALRHVRPALDGILMLGQAAVVIAWGYCHNGGIAA